MGLDWPVFVPISVFVAILLCFFVVWFAQTHGEQSLNTAINAVLLVLGVVSVWIALNAYWEAQTSGEKQMATLEKSRRALESVLESMETSKKSLESMTAIANAQRDLLDRSVKTSGKMASIVEEQWKRETAQPDVHAVLFYPKSLSIMLRNASKLKVARKIRWQVTFHNLDRPYEGRFDIASSAATTIDYLSPGESHMPAEVRLITSLNPAPVKVGERLFGYVTINCDECVSRRVYWVYLKMGEQGSYAEGTENEFPFFSQLTTANIDEVLRRFFKKPDLQRIRG
jgi:hypothetical protein